MENQELQQGAALEQPARRSGDRRKDAAPVDADKRARDRRVNKPGLMGLIGDLLRR